MKKILPISILGLSLGFALNVGMTNSASARILTPSGDIGMTITEIPAFEQKAKIELEKSCGDDLWCQREEMFMLAETDSRYEMLNQFYNEQLLITSFTPSDNSLNMLFQAHGEMMRWIDDDLPKDSLNDLRMGWSDRGTPRPVEHWGIETDRGQMPTGFHYIYLWDSGNGSRSTLPTDENFTIYAMDGDFNLINDDIIQYSFSSNESGAIGAFIVRDCVLSPYYEEGVECRAVFTEQSGLIYLPYKDGVPTYPNYLYLDDLEEDNNNNNSSNNNDDNANYGSIDADDGLKAPDTSIVKQDLQDGEAGIDKVYSVSLPWWLPVLIIVCSGIMIAFFCERSLKITAPFKDF